MVIGWNIGKKRKKDRKKTLKEELALTDVPLSGHQGIPWGDVETNAIAKTSSWYHVPITRAKPFSVIGNYDESFVRLNEDFSRIPSDVTDKVFVAVDKIRDDYETTKARDLDTR